MTEIALQYEQPADTHRHVPHPCKPVSLSVVNSILTRTSRASRHHPKSMEPISAIIIRMSGYVPP